MAFDFSTLVTDRKQSDVAYVKQLISKLVEGTETEAELAEWKSFTLKGSYNYTDLNRVNAAMEQLKAQLESYGYAVLNYQKVQIPHSGDLDPYLWYEDDIPTPAQMAQYIANVIAIRSVLELLSTTPEAPEDMEDLTVEEANAIEKILVDVETVIIRVVAGFARTNAFTMWSGNRPLPCTDSDRGRIWSELDGMKVPWVNLNRVDWYLLAYGHLRGDNA